MMVLFVACLSLERSESCDKQHRDREQMFQISLLGWCYYMIYIMYVNFFG